jgi:hypothetical protein
MSNLYGLGQYIFKQIIVFREIVYLLKMGCKGHFMLNKWVECGRHILGVEIYE